MAPPGAARRMARSRAFRHKRASALKAMKTMLLTTLRVRARPGRRTEGWLIAGPLALPVALGRGGVKANKREGDGGTPRGTFVLRRLWWRADRMPRPRTGLPVRRIRRNDGWCEDPADRRYNGPIDVPPGSSADRLWRGTRSTTSSSRSATTPGRGSPGGAARCLSISPGRNSLRPPVASRSKPAPCAG